MKKIIFGKQKFDVKQLKTNKFTFDVKQLKRNRFIKSISALIISTSNATLEVPSLCPCERSDTAILRQGFDLSEESLL